jgi:hypothetical protein
MGLFKKLKEINAKWEKEEQEEAIAMQKAGKDPAIETLKSLGVMAGILGVSKLAQGGWK